MSDALTQLNNIRTLRSQTREMSLDVLEDVLEKFKIILIERREEETLRLANESRSVDVAEALFKITVLLKGQTGYLADRYSE